MSIYVTKERRKRREKRNENKIQDHVVWSSIARIPEGIKGKFG